MNIFIRIFLQLLASLVSFVLLGFVLAYGFNTFVATTFAIATITLPVAMAIMVVTIIPFIPTLISVFVAKTVNEDERPLVSIAAIVLLSSVYALTFYILSLFM